ncbi:hypothetical protein IQ272_23185 [Chroococcidiopsidales cyanobacterium LEGE 13417]|nr:hypothetical protein [Chroococcidiopsidales cyanobacterium LEGE 13417]
MTSDWRLVVSGVWGMERDCKFLSPSSGRLSLVSPFSLVSLVPPLPTPIRAGLETRPYRLPIKQGKRQLDPLPIWIAPNS